MSLYVYSGDERTYPSVPVTVNDGDVFDWPDGEAPDDGRWSEYSAPKKGVAAVSVRRDNELAEAPAETEGVVIEEPPVTTSTDQTS